MKHLFRRLLFCVIGLILLASTSHAAGFVCSPMEITNAGVEGIWVKNVSGASCGAIPNGGQEYFSLNPSNTDRLLAIALTSISLGKTVYIGALGDTRGSVITAITMQR
jgi:hypothetical protein